jgi:hypothetical protein
MRKPIKSWTRSVCVASALAALAVLPAIAQDQPEVLRLARVKVKPNMAEEHRALQATINEGLKKAGVPWRDLWQMAGFGDVGSFVSVTPMDTLAVLDGPNPLLKGLGQEAFAAYQSRARNVYESAHYELVRIRRDLSLVSGRSEPPTLAVVTTIRTVPGKEDAFEELIRSDIAPAWKKGGVKDAWVHKTILGGSPQTYTIVVLYEKFAELDGGSPIEKALGPEGMRKLRQKSAGVIASMENMVARRIAELSYR